MDLITLDDIEDRAGRTFTSDEIGRIGALIKDVSAAIRVYTGRPFQVTTSTARKIPANGVVVLRQRGISSITSVKTIAGVTVDYTWDGLNTVSVGYAWRFDYEYPTGMTTEAVDIVYVHGTAIVPDAIKAVAAQVVARAFGQPADQSGVQQEAIAGYSYTIGSAAAAGPVGFLAAEMRTLDAYKPVGGTARVSVR